jgi:hypothetical protein
MGIVHHDRYLHSMWSPRPGGGGGGNVFHRIRNSFRRLPHVVRILILLQAALYGLMLVLGDRGLGLASWVIFSPERFLDGLLWTPLVYWAFHFGNDPLGILFDVVLLWSLGGVFAQRWRPAHFLFFYGAGNVGAALVDLLLYLLMPGTFAAGALGSAGASFALFVAFYLVFGDSYVSVFGSAPMKGKWVFIAVFGLELLFFITGVNAHFGLHLGGVLTGWLLVTGRWRPRKFKTWLDGLKSGRDRRRREEQKSRFRVIH